MIYPGPRPFSREEAQCFFGRGREIRDLHDLLLSHRAVLLYAGSGLGKTSLINAGLLPRLGEGAVVCRVGAEIPPPLDADAITNVYVFNTVRTGLPKSVSLKPEELATATLAEYLEYADYIVFDQFEELVTAFEDRWRDRARFFEDLRELMAKRPDLHVLFSTREDYLPAINAYADLAPERFHVRYRLRGLTPAGARDAIVGSAKTDAPHAISGVADDIVRQLQNMPLSVSRRVRGRYVDPFQLQVVCHCIRRAECVGSERESIRAAAADLDAALVAYYDRIVTQAAVSCGFDEGVIRAWFGTELITPNDTRRVVYFDPVDERCGTVPADVAAALDPLVRAELWSGSRSYELCHDRFIGPIRASNTAWTASLAGPAAHL